MNRIKHLSQLNAEKKRLKQRSEELEELLQNDWKAVKTSVQPKNVVTGALVNLITSPLRSKSLTNDLVASAVILGAGMLTKKLTPIVRKGWGKLPWNKNNKFLHTGR